MNRPILAGMLMLAIVTLGPIAAAAIEPLAVIKEPIDAVIVILNDPQYKALDTRPAQRSEIWKTVKPMFDFTEVSMRALARNWRRFSAAEQEAFVDVFAQFLGNTYIDKIQGEYHDEKIEYLGQTIHEEQYAEVKTKIVRETVEIPVNYRMRKQSDGRWKVYDIIVEGVSLVKNYRIQFASILNKKKPAQLIEQLNEKLEDQNRRLAGSE